MYYYCNQHITSADHRHHGKTKVGRRQRGQKAATFWHSHKLPSELIVGAQKFILHFKFRMGEFQLQNYYFLEEQAKNNDKLEIRGIIHYLPPSTMMPLVGTEVYSALEIVVYIGEGTRREVSCSHMTDTLSGVGNCKLQRWLLRQTLQLYSTPEYCYRYYYNYYYITNTITVSYTHLTLPTNREV